MNNILLASTGTMVGKINGWDPYVFFRYHDSVASDGFEFMAETGYFDIKSTIIDEIHSRGISIRSYHALKVIGDMLSSEATADAGLELFEKSCEFARDTGASLIVLHLWSGPSSDTNIETNFSYIPKLCRTAESFNIMLAVENVPCLVGSPFERIAELHRRYPSLHFVVDTRFLALHNEFEKFLSWEGMYDGAVAHLHISEFAGTYREFSALRPILHPGEGKTDFNSFFDRVIPHFNGMINLESPVMGRDGPDIEKLNRSLGYIRGRIELASGGHS